MDIPNIFKIEDGKIIEWEVVPNDLIPGWFIITEVDPTKEWLEVRPLGPDSLDPESPKKNDPTYVGMQKCKYYKSRKEAEIILAGLLNRN